MKKRLIRAIVLLMMAITLVGIQPAMADNSGDGAKLFTVHCAGCHANGGNIIRRGKTLKLKALAKNHLDTQEAIAQLITQGKNPMPAYNDRLSVTEIEAVGAYVLEQAERGWK
ncbi:c-type cytochrome [Laspinema olomoucense]|uniref:C-type cytochrome n=1 Tax=Laspinema olomoucense D3b TaxID=2953688 RepID=A0ABT2NA46_9CYAN|nr:MULTISPECIES: c-type cytochrome [unclassified Laspinema]MCT7972096.1 c-type cytochrome [Laspinema sp. D3d]MCT7978141.1 c-type cytochrome [Laspinema sp. D3b]MCT7991490.1 c-type cytochrome [Laspinema sp. D3a]MCT7995004.1 c-type cytochrome [Laspinema sp. D3c]